MTGVRMFTTGGVFDSLLQTDPGLAIYVPVQISGDRRVSPLLPYAHDIWLGSAFGTGRRKEALFREDDVVWLKIRKSEF